jgi:hypothetical protein
MQENHQNGRHKMSSVDELLPIANESENLEDETNSSQTEDEDELEEEDLALVRTKHDFVTSPWSRLGIIGGAFGSVFIIVFIILSSMMDGSKTSQKPLISPTPSPATINPEKKDGDVYAKLALAKQQEELEALNGKKAQEEPSTKSTTETKKPPIQQPKAQPRVVTQTETLPPQRRRVYQEIATEPVEYRPRRRQVASQPIPPLRPTVTRSNTDAILAKLALNQTQTVAKDPMAEIERLRSLGSVGRIQYMAVKTTEPASTVKETTTQVETINNDTAQTTRRRNNRSLNTEVTSTQVEQLRPRWQPTNLDDGASQHVYGFLPEETQILQETKPQYLVAGSFASATLVTPLVFSQSSNNNRSGEQTNTLRFIAQLDEPLYSNTGEIAIPAGTKVTIAMVAVDSGSRVNAEVTAIIKDETEYPVSSGTISVLDRAGSPLIARPYENKGPEIAKYDTTLGAIAGIAKVGEIINKPDAQVTQVLPLGGTITSSSNNKHNIGAAFVEGAFGKLSETVGKRTERATNEIMSRPVVWYVPKGTKITILVDRSLKL